MDRQFQILTPIDLIQTRTVGVSDTTYGNLVFRPNETSALLQGEWLYPTATYKVMDRGQLPATVRVIASGPCFPTLDLRGQYDVQANPGPNGGISVAFAGSTFEVYTNCIATSATPGNMTIGTPVGIATNTVNIAGGGGGGSSRAYLNNATYATDWVVGWVIRPYSATTGYVGVLMSLAGAR